MPNTATKALVLAPSIPGNRGDQAMLIATAQALRSKGFKEIALIAFPPGSRSALPPEYDKVYALPRPGPVLGFLTFLNILRRYDAFFCIGADVIDGFYSERLSLQRLRMTDAAARLKGASTILGFSFNDSPMPSVVNKLKKLSSNVRMCIRDPHSFQRMLHVNSRSSIRTADVAFLLQPTDSDLEDVLDKAKLSGNLNIGLNLNSLHLNEDLVDNSAQLLDAYLKLIESLVAEFTNVFILLVPHDIRPTKTETDVSLAEALMRKVSTMPGVTTALCSPKYSAAQVKKMCGYLDFAITGRMHFAIACLGMRTPAVTINHQGKVTGLYEELSIPELVLPLRELISGNARYKIIELIKRRQELNSILSSKIPLMEIMARKNFD